MQICIFADFIDFDEKKVSTVAADSAMFKSMKELQNVNRKSANSMSLFILNFHNKFSDVTHDSKRIARFNRNVMPILLGWWLKLKLLISSIACSCDFFDAQINSHLKESISQKFSETKAGRK